MDKKRIRNGIFLLVLFVVGGLWMPIMHRLQHVQPYYGEQIDHVDTIPSSSHSEDDYLTLHSSSIHHQCALCFGLIFWTVCCQFYSTPLLPSSPFYTATATEMPFLQASQASARAPPVFS